MACCVCRLERQAQMNKAIALEARNLSFAYQTKINIIKHLNLSLYKGETVVLLGANGGGKTTLGKLLTGILKPSSGDLLLFGENLSTMPLFKIGQKLGYSFQNPVQQLFTVSVEEEISFGLKYRGANAEEISRVTEQLMKLFEIEHLRDAFPLNLSWGEKRRVVLASCLALQPEYLILDEPTTGLDQKRIDILNRVLNNLRQEGAGMLLISHNQSFVRENAQRILRMEKGAIVDDLYL